MKIDAIHDTHRLLSAHKCVCGWEGDSAVAHVIDALIATWPDHYVTFDADGWFVEHSMGCRLAGTIGTCAYNKAIREVADDGPPDDLGRWRITEIDSEGLPSLERAGADLDDVESDDSTRKADG